MVVDLFHFRLFEFENKVVGPIEAGDFRAADFKTLEDYEYRKRVESVEVALKEVAPLVSEDKYAPILV